MKTFLSLIFIMASTSAAFGFDVDRRADVSDIKNGEKIFNSIDSSSKDSLIFDCTGDDRKIKNLQRLGEVIIILDGVLELNLFPDEVSDLAVYIDHKYCKFADSSS